MSALTLRDGLLLGSVVVNVLSVAATVFTWRRSQEAQRLQAQMDRYFYDIDLVAARREGVTEKQIAYLVLAVNALMADWRARPGRIGLWRRRTLFEFIRGSTYWSHLLCQPRTALVWGYAQNCISQPARKEIARFIAAHVQ